MVGLPARLQGPDLRLAGADVVRQLQRRHRQVRRQGHQLTRCPRMRRDLWIRSRSQARSVPHCPPLSCRTAHGVFSAVMTVPLRTDVLRDICAPSCLVVFLLSSSARRASPCRRGRAARRSSPSSPPPRDSPAIEAVVRELGATGDPRSNGPDSAFGRQSLLPQVRQPGLHRQGGRRERQPARPDQRRAGRRGRQGRHDQGQGQQRRCAASSATCWAR